MSNTDKAMEIDLRPDAYWPPMPVHGVQATADGFGLRNRAAMKGASK
jgi:hypothetical protein